MPPGRPPRPRNESATLRLRWNRQEPRPDLNTATSLIYDALQTPLAGIYKSYNGYVARLMAKDRDVVNDGKIIQKLKINGFEKIESPAERAQRTVLARRVADSIGARPSRELEREIEEKNENLAGVVDYVTKIKNYTRMFKITFKTKRAADVALENGIKLFYMIITPDQLERERYTELQMCYTCYKYEDHNTGDCPMEKKQCSECGSPDHDYRTCRSETKKCLNCGGPHRTMAMACPVRKQKVQEAIDRASTPEPGKSYAEAMKSISTAAKNLNPTPTPSITLDSTHSQTLTMCILYAQFSTLTKPGTTFAANLDKCLAANGQKPFNIPSELEPTAEELLPLNLNLAPSAQHPSSFKAPEVETSKKPTTTLSDVPQPLAKPSNSLPATLPAKSKPRAASRPPGKRSSEEANMPPSNRPPKMTHVRPADVGLKIYSGTLVKKDWTSESIYNKIKAGQLAISFDKTIISRAQVLELLRQNRITNLSTCTNQFTTMERLDELKRDYT